MVLGIVKCDKCLIPRGNELTAPDMIPLYIKYKKKRKKIGYYCSNCGRILLISRLRTKGVRGITNKYVPLTNNNIGEKMDIEEVVEKLQKVILRAGSLLALLPEGSVERRWVKNKAGKKYYYYYLRIRSKKRQYFLGKSDRGLAELCIVRNELRRELRDIIKEAKRVLLNMATYADQVIAITISLEERLEELEPYVRELKKQWDKALQA